MKETENDELTGVIQKLVMKYQDDILPIAIEMVTRLATTFQQVHTSLLLSLTTFSQSVLIFLLIMSSTSFQFLPHQSALRSTCSICLLTRPLFL